VVDRRRGVRDLSGSAGGAGEDEESEDEATHGRDCMQRTPSGQCRFSQQPLDRQRRRGRRGARNVTQDGEDR
jgi:hypothetical protein